MRRFLFTGLAVVAIVMSPLAASASIYVGDDNLIGSRSTAGTDEIHGESGWSGGASNNGFEIHWEITDNGGGSWNYKYWFSGAVVLYNANGGDADPLSKGLSHWILQISDGKSLDDNFSGFASSDPNDPIAEATYADTDANAGSNPGLTGSIYGIKWETTDDDDNPNDPDGSVTVWYSFTSTETPVWGDFYAKDGVINPGQNDVVAWNVNFGVTPTLFEDSYSGWIARPNGDVDEPGPTPIPEPSTWLVFSGLFACFGVNAWRKKKRTA